MALAVYRSGEQLLAGAGFAQQEHACICRCYGLDLMKDMAPGGAVADHLLEIVFGVDLCFEIKPLHFQVVARSTQASVSEGVVKCQRDLSSDLRQQIEVGFAEGICLAAAHTQKAQRTLSSDEGHRYS